MYGGLNWNPELRSPLTEPGVNVRAGEYLLAVDGRDVKPPANLYGFFENTSGKITEITVGRESRRLGLPHRRRRADRDRDRASQPRLGRGQHPQGQRGDERPRRVRVRAEHGDARATPTSSATSIPRPTRTPSSSTSATTAAGSLADYYIDVLQKPLIAYWAMRYGADMKTPSASIQGPKVMIIDENAGSGGDLLPWMWRKFKVGPIIGQRTWGGLVGILGFPVLMDGGTITAPNLAIWDAEKGWVVENEGVPPDIEIEQTPADVIAGRDPQLEKAIAVVLDELKKNPPQVAEAAALSGQDSARRGGGGERRDQ